jgi:hypothetical protein
VLVRALTWRLILKHHQRYLPIRKDSFRGKKGISYTQVRPTGQIRVSSDRFVAAVAVAILLPRLPAFRLDAGR